jgi:hypothetical protein
MENKNNKKLKLAEWLKGFFKKNKKEEAYEINNNTADKP